MSITVRPTNVTIRGGRALRVTVDRTTVKRIQGGMGPRGPQGEEAAGATLTLPAGSALHAGRAVRLQGGGGGGAQDVNFRLGAPGSAGGGRGGTVSEAGEDGAPNTGSGGGGAGSQGTAGVGGSGVCIIEWFE